MAKFPTTVESSVTVKVPLGRAYEFMWDVVGSSACIPGLEKCKAVGEDTYQFVYEERSTGPVSLTVRYTSRYQGNGTDTITFESFGKKGDNTDVEGLIKLKPKDDSNTRITLKQMLAPDTPVPTLLQGLIRGFVESEATAAVKQYLANVKATLGP